MLVPIIMGSGSDLEHGQSIAKALEGKDPATCTNLSLRCLMRDYDLRAPHKKKGCCGGRSGGALRPATARQIHPSPILDSENTLLPLN